MRGVSTALGEIAFFLALAGLIGIGIGWVLRDWAFYNKAEELARRLREDRAEFRRFEEASAARERELRREIAERDAVIEGLEGADVGGDIILAGRPLRPGAVMNPGGFGAPQSAPDDGTQIAMRGPARAETDARTARPDAGPDDLQEIRGVGPTLARRMNEYGITTFRQLADLKDDDVDELADAIRISKGRIRRDDWVGDAARLDDRRAVDRRGGKPQDGGLESR